MDFYKELAAFYEQKSKELAQQNWDLIQHIQELAYENEQLKQQITVLDEAC
jgi:hypothetical protein